MKKYSKLNTKRLASIILILIIFVLSAYFFDKYKEAVKVLLESRLTTFFVWGYVIAVFSAQRFFVGSNASKDSFIYAHFGKYADTLFTVGTYGLASSTSLALIKGLYIQVVFGAVFYKDFNAFDLVSMFILSSFLFIYSMFATTRILLDLVFYSQTECVEVKNN